MSVPLSLCIQVWVLTCCRVSASGSQRDNLYVGSHLSHYCYAFFVFLHLQSSGEFPVSVSHVTIGTLELWMCTTMLSFIQVRGFKSCPCAYTAGAVPTERALQSHKQFSCFIASSLK